MKNEVRLTAFGYYSEGADTDFVGFADTTNDKYNYAKTFYIDNIPSNELEGVQEVVDRLAEYENTNLSPTEVKALKAENAELKARLNPKTLYGIEKGKVEKLVNVKVEYHFDIKSSAFGGWIEADEIGKYAFLTESEAEKVLKEKGE